MGSKIQWLYNGSESLSYGDRTGVSQVDPRCTDPQAIQPIVSDPRDMRVRIYLSFGLFGKQAWELVGAEVKVKMTLPR